MWWQLRSVQNRGSGRQSGMSAWRTRVDSTNLLKYPFMFDQMIPDSSHNVLLWVPCVQLLNNQRVVLIRQTDACWIFLSFIWPWIVGYLTRVLLRSKCNLLVHKIIYSFKQCVNSSVLFVLPCHSGLGKGHCTREWMKGLGTPLKKLSLNLIKWSWNNICDLAHLVKNYPLVKLANDWVMECCISKERAYGEIWHQIIFVQSSTVKKKKIFNSFKQYLFFSFFFKIPIENKGYNQQNVTGLR